MTETMTSTWVNPDLSKTPEELIAERSARIRTAYAMAVPDRIPLSMNIGYLSAEMGGVPHAEVYRDRALRLTETSAGRYQGEASGIAAGAWDVVVTAASGQTPFEASRRLWLP